MMTTRGDDDDFKQPAAAALLLLEKFLCFCFWEKPFSDCISVLPLPLITPGVVVVAARRF